MFSCFGRAQWTRGVFEYYNKPLHNWEPETVSLLPPTNKVENKSTRAEVSPKWVDPAPSNTWSLGLARVYILNGTSIGSSVFAWFTLVTDRHRYTDHATYATTGRIWCYALRCCLATSTTADLTWLRPEHGISNDLPPTTRASPSLLSFR